MDKREPTAAQRDEVFALMDDSTDQGKRHEKPVIAPLRMAEKLECLIIDRDDARAENERLVGLIQDVNSASLYFPKDIHVHGCNAVSGGRLCNCCLPQLTQALAGDSTT